MEVDEKIGEINPRYKDPSVKKKVTPTSVWEHNIEYDSTSEQLEPIYFWILDFMQDKLGLKVEKLLDNFAASTAGGYFSEIGAKSTKMQEEGMKIMGTINTLIRTVINLIYDLKDFEIRVSQYDKVKDKDPRVVEAALLSLKNVWLDKVDMPQRGRGSIHQMTYELGFTTLRDAFLAAKTLADVDKLDLNDRVKRVLKPRLAEFYDWLDRSEKELRKRYEIEKNYLRSEVAALKLYTRWAKPYLKAAEELRMNAGKRNEKGRITDPALVTAFNTMILEVTLLGIESQDPQKLVHKLLLPREFINHKFKREYSACVLVKFNFRGIPFRTQQGHYVFGGKANVSIKGYALNNEELSYLRQEIDKDDLATALNLVEDTTENSLKQLQEDLEHFLNDKGSKKEESKKENKEILLKNIKKDDFKESILRKCIEQIVANSCFTLYDIFKKAHGMASFLGPDFDTEELRSSFNKKL